MSRDDNAMANGLVAYLQGYGRNNLNGLAAIAAYGAWPLLAARDSERRMAQILQSLPIDEVQAIARLEINFNELACQVLRELDAERHHGKAETIRRC